MKGKEGWAPQGAMRGQVEACDGWRGGRARRPQQPRRSPSARVVSRLNFDLVNTAGLTPATPDTAATRTSLRRDKGKQMKSAVTDARHGAVTSERHTEKQADMQRGGRQMRASCLWVIQPIF